MNTSSSNSSLNFMWAVLHSLGTIVLRHRIYAYMRMVYNTSKDIGRGKPHERESITPTREIYQ